MTQENKILDEQIITQLRSGAKSFEDASMYLFHNFQGFIPTIKRKLNLSQSDLQDAYADALVKLITKLKNGSFKGESKISTYFYTIFYNTCVDVSRKHTSNKVKATKELHEYDARERDLIQLIDNKDEANQVISLISQMGETCKSILIDWAYYGYSMTEIAERSDLSNAESARSVKYKCLKKLKAILSKQENNL